MFERQDESRKGGVPGKGGSGGQGWRVVLSSLSQILGILAEKIEETMDSSTSAVL